MFSLPSITRIKVLRDCEVGYERRIHEGEGCDCSVPDRKWLYKDEVLEEYELYNTDISGLKFGEDYAILEVK